MILHSFKDAKEIHLIWHFLAFNEQRISKRTEEQLEQLKKGMRIITNTISFQSEKYKVNRIGPVDFSWGEEEVFIHEKL